MEQVYNPRILAEQALDLALDMVGYGDLRKRQKEKRADGKLYGIGLASHASSAPYVTFNVNPAGASGSSVSVYYGQSQSGGSSPS